MSRNVNASVFDVISSIPARIFVLVCTGQARSISFCQSGVFTHQIERIQRTVPEALGLGLDNTHNYSNDHVSDLVYLIDS